MYIADTSAREHGFSLVELLIVVAIIATLAAIALPNFFESKQAAHNASAVASLRLISSAEISYRATNAQYADLATLGAQSYISDPLLAAGQRSYYTFIIPSATLSQGFYEVTATPARAPWRFYYMDASGIIRMQLGAPADGTSQPID